MWSCFSTYQTLTLILSRQERISDAAKKASFVIKMADGTSATVVRTSDLNQHHHMSNITHTVQDIHDILKSYYKVALKRFIDTICIQAADWHLVTGPDAPMHLFSSSWVHGLSNQQLEDIAGEEVSIQRKRQILKKQVRDLENGRKILL